MSELLTRDELYEQFGGWPTPTSQLGRRCQREPILAASIARLAPIEARIAFVKELSPDVGREVVALLREHGVSLDPTADPCYADGPNATAEFRLER